MKQKIIQINTFLIFINRILLAEMSVFIYGILF